MDSQITSEIETLKRELKISRARFEAAIPHITNSLWEYDHELKTLTRLAGGFPGFDFDSVIYDAPDKILGSFAVHPDSYSDIALHLKDLIDGKEAAEREIKFVSVKGEANWFSVSFVTVFDGGKPIRALISTENITVKKERELRYERERKYLESIVSGAILSFEVNLTRERIERLNGYPVSEDSFSENGGAGDICLQFLLRGDNWIISPYDRDIVETNLHSRALLNAYNEGRMKVKCEYRRINSSEQSWVRVSASLVDISESGDVYAFIYVKNIDDVKEAEQALKKKASLDSLTGFCNREYGINQISDALVLRKQGTVSALLMLDLDNFKLLNDTHGHSAGDRLLSDMAGVVRSLVRKDDIVCRLGGDEFFIFMNNINEKLVKSRARVLLETVDGLGRKVAEAPRVTVSIGIAFVDDFSLSFKKIYEMADAALYEAKGNGKNCYVIYSEPNDSAETQQHGGDTD